MITYVKQNVWQVGIFLSGLIAISIYGYFRPSTGDPQLDLAMPYFIMGFFFILIMVADNAKRTNA